MAGQLIQRGDKKWLVRVYAGRVKGKRTYGNDTKKEATAVLKVQHQPLDQTDGLEPRRTARKHRELALHHRE